MVRARWLNQQSIELAAGFLLAVAHDKICTQPVNQLFQAENALGDLDKVDVIVIPPVVKKPGGMRNGIQVKAFNVVTLGQHGFDINLWQRGIGRHTGFA